MMYEDHKKEGKIPERLEGDVLSALQHADRTLDEFVRSRRRGFHRFPIVFTLLGGSGLALFFYGAQRLLETSALFSEHPLLALFLGLAVLMLTGGLYKLVK